MPRSEEGIPIGNGKMGSLVWTSPTALKLQINRVDLQPINSETHSFPVRNSDYMGDCAFADIDLAGSGPDVITSDTTQHLSVYDGLMSLKAPGVSARALAWMSHDVMAVELDDERSSPEPLQASLRMLRYESQDLGAQLEKMFTTHTVVVRTREHLASSTLDIRGNRILLIQEFHEGSHSAKSAVAMQIVGRASTPRYANDYEVRLMAPGAKGKAVVLIASAASENSNDDIAAAALRELDAVGQRNFDALASENADWWHAFWNRGTLSLHSADGTADYVASTYHYFLYLMASTSRGAFPPKFNGMLWNTAGDLRVWGTQHWFANLSCYYEALFESNRLELLDPVFSMYYGMYDAAALAARQQWGSEGIFIPETSWHDGLEKLPDDIAAEMRDLYLLKKPWSQRSARFIEYSSTKNPLSSRWNWIASGKWEEGRWVPIPRDNAPFGPVTHNLGTTGKVAYLFWRRYEYTKDAAWLKDRAYPMLKGAAELYHHFPNFGKEADGKYHIHHVNSNESVTGGNDTDEDLSAMRGVFAAAVKASEILNTDAELRAQWKDILDNLSPLPTSDMPDATKPDNYTGPDVFVRAIKPVASGMGFTPDGNSLPQWFFDIVNLDADPKTLALANATFDRGFRAPIGPTTQVGVLSKIPLAGTTLGRVEATRYLVPNQMKLLTTERPNAYKGGAPLANRMALREGEQALDAERLGRASDALEVALMQSFAPTPAGDPVIRLFPAWPDDWDARFTLRARGGFVVTAARHAGKTDLVQIVSEAGGVCRIRNPFGAAAVTVYRNGTRWRRLTGPLLTFDTAKDETILLDIR